MKAVGYTKSLPTSDPACFADITLPDPELGPHDVLVAVYGMSVNPVDTKIRMRREPAAGSYDVIGWDAAGTVIALGDKVVDFKEGDEVWYAGALTRAGCNAQYQVVDARIISKKPEKLNFAQAAAMPLTFLTAWELLFDRLQVTPEDNGTLLITGAAGGVGSALIQLASRLTGLTVIATASRAESQQWVKALGAHLVINHHDDMATQLAEKNIEAVNYVASLTHTEQHFSVLAEMLAPQGKFALIDDPAELLDIRLLKQKSISLHWEFMFTRSLFNTDDIYRQGQILQEIADLTDAGLLRSTKSRHFGTLSAENLRKAHEQLESQSTIGKVVLDGYNVPLEC